MNWETGWMCLFSGKSSFSLMARKSQKEKKRRREYSPLSIIISTVPAYTIGYALTRRAFFRKQLSLSIMGLYLYLFLKRKKTKAVNIIRIKLLFQCRPLTMMILPFYEPIQFPSWLFAYHWFLESINNLLFTWIAQFNTVHYYYHHLPARLFIFPSHLTHQALFLQRLTFSQTRTPNT